MSSADPRHWQNFARLWSLLGPPLRPAPEDVAIVAAVVETWSQKNGPPCGAILGVTPELYPVLSAVTSDIVAVDNSQAMIDQVWPGPPDQALCAEWTSMPLPDESRDIVLCDGGMILLDHPTGHVGLVSELRRIVTQGGLCAIRLFVPPAKRETPEAILNDLMAGRVANLNRLKLRLWVSLQTDLRHGMAVDSFWSLINIAVPDLDGLAAQIGWSPDEVKVLRAYDGSPTRYRFPTLDEVERLFCVEPGGFTMESVATPTYELGERCPTVVFRKA